MDKAAASAWLDSLAGDWKRTNLTWFEPDVLADESPIAADHTTPAGDETRAVEARYVRAR